MMMDPGSSTARDPPTPMRKLSGGAKRVRSDEGEGGREEEIFPTRKATTTKPTTTATTLGAAKGKEGDGRVQVLVRMRSILPSEAHQATVPHLHVNPTSSTIAMTHMGRDYNFHVDKIFQEGSSQQNVFDEGGLKQTITSVVKQGKNACVFAYGCSGTGKTFTMQGGTQRNQEGVIPKALRQVLNQAAAINRRAMSSCQITLSYMDIYNDKLRDLLAGGTATTTRGACGKERDLAIREDHLGNICVPGLLEKSIKSCEEFQGLYTKANAFRKTSSTLLNQSSSRSHAVLMIRVVQKSLSSSNKDNKGVGMITGKLHLIDLAGSERNGKTGNRGERLQESGNINLSLFVLGKVIDGLNSGDSRIPFRDSKLTRLLQDSLGGSSSHAIMICCIAPLASLASETCQALGYAAKARSIINRPKALHPADQEDEENEPPKTSQAMQAMLNQWRASKVVGIGPPPSIYTSITKAASSSYNNNKRKRGEEETSTTSSTMALNNTTSRNGRPMSTASITSSAAPFSHFPSSTTTTKSHSTIIKPGSTSSTFTTTSSTTTSSSSHNHMQKRAPFLAPPLAAPAATTTTIAARKSSATTIMSFHPPGHDNEEPKEAAATTTATATKRDLSPGSVVQAKDMIVAAKEAEKRNDLTDALRLYQAAQLLLPGHQKLGQRLATLRQRIQKEADMKVKAEAARKRSVSMMDAVVPTTTSDAEEEDVTHADALHEVMASATKARPPTSTTMMRMRREEDDMDFQDDDYYRAEDGQGLMAYEPSSTLQDSSFSSFLAPLPEGKMESLKSLHKEIRNVLEAEIIDLLNEGSKSQLLGLHGIGKKRAELILQLRDSEGPRPFRDLSDLHMINMTEKTIGNLLKLNTLGRLDVVN